MRHATPTTQYCTGKEACAANRKGPRDKKVDEIQIFRAKGSFAEKGSNCGVEF